ncbi:MAG: hypothetical protein N3A66_02860 [Planctomycetota bacterium]|nr:hypothetical protein [Planctomycetota bacterium]
MPNVPPNRPAPRPGSPRPVPRLAPRAAPPPEPEENVLALYGKWIVRGVVFGALALAALMIVPRFLRGMKVKPKWDEAVAACEAQDYRKALSLFKEARDIAPDYQEGLPIPGLGGRSMSELYPEEAAKCYQGLALKAEEEGKWAEAAAVWKEMIEDIPEKAKAEDAYFKAAQNLDRVEEKDSSRKAKLKEEAKKYARLAIDKAGGKHPLAEALLKRLQK